MKKTFGFLLEIFPLAVFFIGSKYTHLVLDIEKDRNLIYATGMLMAATLIAIIGRWLLEKKLAIMPIITLIIVLIFGGLTIYLDNAFFIKIKPTILNLCFASVLLGGLLFKKKLLTYVMGPVLNMDEAGWHKLTLMWGLFFIALAGLNELIWRNFAEDIWINFKVFGMAPITIIFSMLTMVFINKHLIVDEDEAN